MRMPSARLARRAPLLVGWVIAAALACENVPPVVSDDSAADPETGDAASGRPVAACSCASSPELTALGCDLAGDVALWPDARPLVAPDGSAASFVSCRRSADDSLLATCDTFRWTSAGESVRLRGVAAVDMSDDAATLLVDAGNGLQLLRTGAPPVPLPTEIQVGSARLTRDGASVFGVFIDTGTTSLVRWTEATGTEFLGELTPGDPDAGRVTDLTADGSLVVGYTDFDEPFRWSAAGGLEGFGATSGARPLAVSADGTTIAGVTTSSLLTLDVFRLRVGAEEVSVLGPAATGGDPDLDVLRVSADGSVVAGATSVGGASQILRSSQLEGALLLDTALPASLADMTPDGLVIVGSAGNDGFRWNHEPGDPDNPQLALGPGRVLAFAPLLGTSGVDLTGWQLEAPVAVSDDGQIVFGRARCGALPTLYRWVMPR